MRRASRNCWPQTHIGCPPPCGVFMMRGWFLFGLFSRQHLTYSEPPSITSWTRPYFTGSSMKRPKVWGSLTIAALEDRHFTLPVFFRTDEVRPGRINEINCPAALWGELQLAFEYAARMGYCAGDGLTGRSICGSADGLPASSPHRPSLSRQVHCPRKLAVLHREDQASRKILGHRPRRKSGGLQLHPVPGVRRLVGG